MSSSRRTGTGAGGGRRPVRVPRGPVGLADVVDVDPRIEARRAEVRLDRLARRRRQWLIGSVAVTVIALLYGATRTALLDVDDVKVLHAVRTPAEDVQAASAVRIGDPLADVDAEQVAAAVEALPWVQRATVTRRWSGSVDIAVTERVPAAVVEVGGEGGYALVDRHRRILAIQPSESGDLPVVRGIPVGAPGESMPPVLDGALALAAAMPPGLRTRVVSIDVVGDQFELALRPSGRARIGTIDKLDQKVVSLLTMFGQVSLEDLCVMDVSVPEAPVLTRDDPCG